MIRPAMLLAAAAIAGCGGADCPPPPTCPVCPSPPRAETPPPPSPPGPMVEEWIQLPVRILFATSNAVISAENQELLDQAVETMRSRDDILRVRIEGHTDTLGGDSSNAQLAMERAEAVREYLVGGGIPPSVLETEAYGDRRPLVFEAGRPENRAQNRRVEFSALIRRPRDQAGQGL